MSLVGSRPMMEGFRQYAIDTLGIDVPLRPHKSIWDLRYWKLAEVATLAEHLYGDLDGAPVLARKAELAAAAIARTPKIRDWSHLTADGLLALKEEHGTWGKVATALGIKSYCVLWLQRKRLGMISG
jgi:sugar (pentulose or hexulose) kinase